MGNRHVGRETAARVALGELARRFLRQALGAEVLSHVVSIGSVSTPPGTLPGPADLAIVDADPVRCLDPATSEKMVAEIESARKDGDTLGGVVEVVVHGLPPGLGSHVHWDRRLDGRLAGAMMSIHAMKGVEIGDGFQTAARRGSQAHDEIERDEGALRRLTNRAGGIEGGMSTGEPVRVRVAMKPISTVPRALATIDVRTGEPAKAINQRSDVTAVPASGVVAEAMAALVIADAALEKFGGDSVAETRRNLTSYLETAAGKPVSDIFVEDGEPVFRHLEREAVARVIASSDGVVAVGGGAVLDQQTQQRLAGRPVVYLETGFAAAAKRVGLSQARPLLIGNPRATLKALLDQRLPTYQKLAWMTVATDDQDPEQVAAEIATRLHADAGGGHGR